MNAERLVAHLVGWLQEEVEAAAAQGLVFGLSGGIDSAVVARLASRAFPTGHMALIMPIQSERRDVDDARLVVEEFGLQARQIELDPVYEAFVRALGMSPDPDGPPDLALANLKPRLRMATLYFHANRNRALVVGTGNRSELSLGYFTKYGDGGVDLLPLGHLVKREVREIAAALGVPQSIIDKPPSAGIWRGHTDEKELGFNYDELDEYLLAGVGGAELASRIDGRRRKNAHKLRTPKLAPALPETH